MEAYRRLEGCREALRTAADQVFQGMSYQNQQAAKHIFLRIVRPGEGLEVTNKRIPLKDLLPPGEDHERTRAVLQQLIDERLVRLTPGLRQEDTQVEVARRLGKSLETVRKQTKMARARLRARTNAHAVAIAVSLNLI